MQLTWDDILIQELKPEVLKDCLSKWSFLLKGDWAFRAMSKFGDWFLENTEGNIYELSVIEGTFNLIAYCYEDFIKLLNNPEWQEDHLLSFMVGDLHEKGIFTNNNKIYGFAPHPLITQQINIEHIMVLELSAWQEICSKTVKETISTQ